MKLLLVLFLCAGFMAGCERDAAARPFAPDASFEYESYRDVPGVTEDDIRAIEALRDGGARFVFGVMPSTEAFLDENGEILGFVAMFCEFLTRMFGIPFEPAFFDWDDLVAGLESGEIDFTGELTATDERRKTYFMTDPIILRTVSLFRLLDSPPISEIAAARTLRYAFFHGVTTEDLVRNASMYPFEVLHVNDYEEAYALLKNGKVDAFFEESTGASAFDDYHEIVAEIFFPVIFSDVSLTTQKPELEPIISVVQNMLRVGLDRFIGEKYRLGYGAYKRHKLHKSFTEKELAYIAENPVIPILAEHDNYPISFYNSREKQYQGISLEILKEVEALTGVTFEIINDHNDEWSKILCMLERGEGSLLTDLVRTPEREGRFLWPSAAYIRDYYVLLSKMDFRNIDYRELLHMRIGLAVGTAYTEMFRRWFPSHTNTVEYVGVDCLFEALEHGEIDLAMASQNLLLYLTNYREHPGFKVNHMFDVTFESTFGIHIGDTLLCDILEKALRQIETEAIARRWINKTYDYRVKIAKERYPFFISIGGLLFCVLVLVLVLMYRARGEGKRLEHEVRERTAAFEEANRAKSQFLAKMSHEIRTPMNAIIGMSELALRKDKLADVREDVKTIHNAGTSLLSIINDILDLSKIESGKMKVVSEDYSVSSLINDVVSITKVKLVDSPVRFDIKVDDAIPGVLSGDVVRIKQALINILNNAVKFTQKGVITFSLKGNMTDGDTVILTMTVSDTGCGIKDEDFDKLFGYFAQLDTGGIRNTEGSGLGLAITKYLVEAMGGYIRVNSEYGRGSSFTITLPQKIRSIIPISLTEPDDYDETGNVEIAFCAPDARVLVVDDVHVNLKVVEGLLLPYKMRVDMCLSGEEAIEAAKAVRYDLIFMDHMMPGMDGVETVKRIRALGMDGGDYQHLRDVPIAALTANAIRGVREMFLQNGFNDFLSKPIDTVKLNAMLKKWIPEEKQAAVESDSGSANNETGDNVSGGKSADIVIDGVYVKLGIGRTGGTVDRYVQTLEVFRKNGGVVMDEIKKSLAANDMDAYVTRVHGLKSAAANIGAVDLSESARELEDATRRGDRAFADENTPKLLADLEALLRGIENAVSSVREKNTNADVDIGALKSILSDLKAAMNEIDIATITATVKRLESYENAPNVGGVVADILHGVLNGDYDEAASRIDSLLREMGEQSEGVKT